MSILMDYILAGIIFGVLALTIARVQVNINSTLFQNTFRVNTQQAGVQLARQIEHDFLKMGHHVVGSKISSATKNSITFLADINNNNTVNQISYSVGNTNDASFTLNPRDFPLKRNIDGNETVQFYGLTSFSIAYYDSLNRLMSFPFSSQQRLDSIKSMDVKFLVENAESVQFYGDTAGTYSAINWEKWIYPRNLGKKDY